MSDWLDKLNKVPANNIKSDIELFDDMIWDGFTRKAYSQYDIESKVFEIFVETGKIIDNEEAIILLDKDGIDKNGKELIPFK